MTSDPRKAPENRAAELLDSEGVPAEGTPAPAAGNGGEPAGEADTAPEPVETAADGEPAPADADPAVDDGPPPDPELVALREQAAKADEYLSLAQRTKADFENYRRRSVRDAAAAQERGVAKLAKELLMAVDNLDRALGAAEAHSATDRSGETDVGSQLLSGIRLVHADVLAAFARVGIEPFSPVGERFDPQLHEAVAHQPVEGADPGTVVEVYQQGYRLGEGVLRPARVLVAA
jgi:molecular chaperone GrpE